MVPTRRLTITPCPVCHHKQGLGSGMRPGTLLVCASCHSHLQVTAQRPVRLLAVDVRLTRTADSQPESFG